MKRILISKTAKVFYEKALRECILSEDETRTWTAVFDDGFEMDIKVCGCKDEPAFTEAVLFKNGYEVACTDCYDELLGEWSIEYNNNKYSAEVVCA